MMKKSKKYPVVFFAFRRPDTTEKVLKEIIKSNPPRLYIFADGLRNTNDTLNVKKTRAAITGLLRKERIEVIRRFRKTNFGLKRNIIEGLDEVFLHEDAAVVLEDDCLPSGQFFDFCNIALDCYSDDYKINTICGTNISSRNMETNGYLVSKYFLPWGWALWKRSWRDYKGISEEELASISQKKGFNKILAWYLSEAYKLSKKGMIGAWSYKMIILQIVKEKFSLFPQYNTVSNIGFGGSSSNTLFKTAGANLKINRESNKLTDNTLSYWNDRDYDRQIAYKLYLTPVSICGLILRKYFPALIKYLYRR